MFESKQDIVGLEIGTSKICAVVGRLNAEGALNIVGIGQSTSSGVRKGEVVDLELVERDVRLAISEAERMSDTEVRSVYLGVSGNHINGFNNRGVHTIVSADRQITGEDMDDVVKNAKAINLSADDHLIHAIRQHYSVDGQEGIPNPDGMMGTRLEVDIHVVHGRKNQLRNAVNVVRNLQLDVESIAFNGLASALALLSYEQKELGTVVLDIGAGTVDYVVYANGAVKHTGVLGVGGDHVSNDLAIGLKMPLGQAEKLKVTHGSAYPGEGDNERKTTLPGTPGLPPRTVNIGKLKQIMNLRLEETFQIIAQQLNDEGVLDYLRAGVVISGGSSRIPRIKDMVERIFQMPVIKAVPQSLGGASSVLMQPEFSTGIGLVRFGAQQRRRRGYEGVAIGRSLKNKILGLLRGDSGRSVA
ncbi:MAG: cell division protein FtsA [Verrucomicrobia bacterium]|nr:cell division protein FtsA [Verrucomicrobiota bacterium]MCF7708301.1 cell division protein FtsA [Verrucomicrobiota bacterium]